MVPYWKESATKSPRSTMRLPSKRSTTSASESRSRSVGSVRVFLFAFHPCCTRIQSAASCKLSTIASGCRGHPPDARFPRRDRIRCEQRPLCNPREMPIPCRRSGHRPRRSAANRCDARAPHARSFPFSACDNRNRRRNCAGNSKLRPHAAPSACNSRCMRLFTCCTSDSGK